MIIEERNYVLHAEAKLSDFMDIYVNEALVVQKPILGGFMGYFTSVFGVLNQLVHWWAYTDLSDREERRARLHEDPVWLSCIDRLRPMLKTMENRILVPTDFSPIRTLPVRIGEPHTALRAE